MTDRPAYSADDDPGLPPPLHRHALLREPLSAEGASGAGLERLVLPDGRRLVLKRLSPSGDWMMGATGDADGRAAALWTEGTMTRLPPSIDDALVRIERDGDAWLLYLRDVSGLVPRRGTTFSRDDARRILGALADLHEAFWSVAVPCACSLEDLLRLCAPAVMERSLPPDDPFRAKVLRGWELFAELAKPRVRNGVAALLDDPTPLADALRAGGTTLVHGDPHLGNVILSPERVVMLDWSLATAAPPAIDFVWFLDHSLHLFDADAEELIDDFRELEGDRHDETTLELAYLAEVVTGGAGFAEPYEGEPRRARVAWWLDRAESALQRLGL